MQCDAGLWMARPCGLLPRSAPEGLCAEGALWVMRRCGLPPSRVNTLCDFEGDTLQLATEGIWMLETLWVMRRRGLLPPQIDARCKALVSVPERLWEIWRCGLPRSAIEGLWVMEALMRRCGLLPPSRVSTLCDFEGDLLRLATEGLWVMRRCGLLSMFSVHAL